MYHWILTLATLTQLYTGNSTICLQTREGKLSRREYAIIWEYVNVQEQEGLKGGVAEAFNL